MTTEQRDYDITFVINFLKHIRTYAWPINEWTLPVDRQEEKLAQVMYAWTRHIMRLAHNQNIYSRGHYPV